MRFPLAVILKQHFKEMKKNIIILTHLLSLTFVFAQTQHKTFYENGKLQEIGQFNDKGKQIGEWKYYYENGNIERIENFKAGKIYSKSYWQNGVLSELNSSENGFFFGRFTMFYDNGKFWSKKKFNQNGQIDGTSKTYFPNGKLSSIEHYKNGERIKNAKIYHENGKISIYAKYENGISTYEEMYRDNGQIYRIEEIDIEKDDIRIISITEIDYHENGKIEKITKHIDGEPKGEWKFYNEKGKLVKIEKY